MIFSINVASRKLGITKLLTLLGIPNNTKPVQCEDLIKGTPIQCRKQALRCVNSKFLKDLLYRHFKFHKS